MKDMRRKYKKLYNDQMNCKLECQDGKCLIPSTQLNNSCDSIKVFYPTKLTSTGILFSVFFDEILSLVLSAKLLFKGLY